MIICLFSASALTTVASIPHEFYILKDDNYLVGLTAHIQVRVHEMVVFQSVHILSELLVLIGRYVSYGLQHPGYGSLRLRHLFYQ
jgi:hypothetical protein